MWGELRFEYDPKNPNGFCEANSYGIHSFKYKVRLRRQWSSQWPIDCLFTQRPLKVEQENMITWRYQYYRHNIKTNRFSYK